MSGCWRHMYGFSRLLLTLDQDRLIGCVLVVGCGESWQNKVRVIEG